MAAPARLGWRRRMASRMAWCRGSDEGGEAGDADGGVERDEQRRVHDRAHLLEHLVVAGLHDGAMEADVRLVVGRVVRRRQIEGVAHVAQGGLQGGDLGRPGAAGGQLRRSRLDQEPDLGELPQEGARGHSLLAPGQDVGIEQVPGLAGPDPRPCLRPRHHQSLGGEDLDRLAHDAPAGAHAGRRRELLAGLDLALHDAAADGVHDAAVLAGPRITGAVGARGLGLGHGGRDYAARGARAQSAPAHFRVDSPADLRILRTIRFISPTIGPNGPMIGPWGARHSISESREGGSYDHAEERRPRSRRGARAGGTAGGGAE